MGATGSPFRMNLISAVSARGQLRFMVTPQRMTATVFVTFLRRPTHNEDRPVFPIVARPTRPAWARTSSPRPTASPGCCTCPITPGSRPHKWVRLHIKNRRVGRPVVTAPARFQNFVPTSHFPATTAEAAGPSVASSRPRPPLHSLRCRLTFTSPHQKACTRGQVDAVHARCVDARELASARVSSAGRSVPVSKTFNWRGPYGE